MLITLSSEKRQEIFHTVNGAVDTVSSHIYSLEIENAKLQKEWDDWASLGFWQRVRTKTPINDDTIYMNRVKIKHLQEDLKKLQKMSCILKKSTAYPVVQFSDNDFLIISKWSPTWNF
jgi:hypothetical protein